MTSSKFSIPNQDKELFRSIISTHVSSDFLPVSDYNIELYGYGMIGSKGRYKKVLITDIDGVWNYGDQIFVGYIKALAQGNKGIENSLGQIKSLVSNICPENVDHTVNRVNEIFRESNVTELQHNYACDHSIDDIYAPGWWWDCMHELEKMDYELFFISGSPNKAVKKFVSKRMRQPGRNVNGSVYNFVDGRFDSIDHLLYKNKRQVALETMIKNVEWGEGTKGFSIVLSDEPGDAEMIKSYESILLLVGDEKIKNGSVVSANIQEFNEDIRILPTIIKRIERALSLYFGYSEEERKLILNSALHFKMLCESMRDEDNERVAAIRHEILQHLTTYTTAVQKLFPMHQSRITNVLSKLRMSSDVDEIKSLSSELFNEFNKISPDAHIIKQIL